MDRDPMIICRLLTGTQARIVLAFVFARAVNGMNIDDLQDWTGISSREPIYHACTSMERHPLGLFTHQVLAHGEKRWYPTGAMLPIFRLLNQGGTELPNGALQIGAPDPARQESSRTTPGIIDVVDVELFSNRPTITTTTTTTRRQESSRTTPESREKRPPKMPLEKKLNQHQITGIKRQQILDAADREDEPITPEYVQAHIDQAIADRHNWDNPVGVAIINILAGLPAPEISSNGHPRNCTCTRCKADRFVNGGGASRTIDRGKRRGIETNTYSRELLIAVAEFMEHEPGCDCFDCQMARLAGTGSLCPVCKHYNCECIEEDSEGG